MTKNVMIEVFQTVFLHVRSWSPVKQAPISLTVIGPDYEQNVRSQPLNSNTTSYIECAVIYINLKTTINKYNPELD